MEIERPFFWRAISQVVVFVTAVALYDPQIFHPAVDLIRRGIDGEGLWALEPNRFQHIKSAKRVGLEIGTGAFDRCRNRDLRRKMQQNIGPNFTDDTLHRVTVADVRPHEVHWTVVLEPNEILGRAFTRKIVDHGHGPALLLKVT